MNSAQERRLEILESKLAAEGGTVTNELAPSHYNDLRVNEPRVHEEMMFRGKAFKTQFYGSTCALSALTRVRCLLCYVWSGSQHLRSFPSFKLSQESP